MTAEEFISVCEGLYGKHDWRRRVAVALGVTGRTVRRWAVEGTNERVALHLKALAHE